MGEEVNFGKPILRESLVQRVLLVWPGFWSEKSSKRLELMFEMPQLQHYQLDSVALRATWIAEFIYKQSLWNQSSQESLPE